MSNGSVASAQWRPPPPAVGGSAKGPSTPAAATTTKTTNGQPVFLTTVTADSAYLTAATYERMLSEVLSLANNPSALTTFESRRSQACGLITAVGGRLGLPVRTIDTAFVVWQKCGVQLGASSGTTGQQVALAAILVACKLCDTIKKAREVIVASFAIRYPDLVKSVPSSSSTTSVHDLSLAAISESDVDPQVLEAERSKVLSLERTMLESVGYDFRIRRNVESVGRGVLKIGKSWGASQAFIRTAWQISSDIHQTPAPLMYPPQVLSLAALLTAALLRCERSDTDDGDDDDDKSAAKVRAMFGLPDAAIEDASTIREWEARFQAQVEDVEDVVLLTLDLYLSSTAALASQRTARPNGHLPTSSSLSTSPLTPTSPASPSEYNSNNSSSSSSARSGVTKFSQLPQHVFNPPPFAVSQWLKAAAHGRGRATRHQQQQQMQQMPPPLPTATATATATPSLASLYSEFSQRLTESKITLRQAEDSRRARESGGDDADTERSRKRARIDEAKKTVQTLRFSVQGDDASGSGSSGDKAEDATPTASSHRSNVVNTSATTVLMDLSEAADVVRARVAAKEEEEQQQKSEQTTMPASLPDSSDAPLTKPASTPTSNGDVVSGAPLPPTTTTESSLETPATATATPAATAPAAHSAGAAAAAAVKAGKAVKTTRFLF